MSPERFAAPATLAGGWPGCVGADLVAIGEDPQVLMAVGAQRPPSRLGRNIDMLIDHRGEFGDLQFPVLLQDPAWTEPENYVQHHPHKVVVSPAVAPNLYISDLSLVSELCATAEVDLSSPDVIASSRKATALLRHGAIRDGLIMDDGGWVPISVLARRVRRSQGALVMIAAADSKGRFQLAHHRVGEQPRTVMLIRATQGHSIKSILDCRLFVRPVIEEVFKWPVLVHATH
ncbi:MAG: RNA 2'-phosphotransferase, partial [bacterium]|nr:RNA 2'-phosphotransferase [bacterium]